MRIAIDHTTLYRYSEPTRSVIQLLKVTPRSFVGQTVLDWRVDVDCDARLREARDGYGNVVHMLYVDRPVQRLCINVTGRVLTEDQAGRVRGLDYQLPPPVFVRATPLTRPGPAIQALADELSAHAWVEAFVDDLGWIAFDPANGICADDAYVRVACGLDYRDAAPVAGARAGGGSEELTVEVEVRETRRQSQAQGQN